MRKCSQSFASSIEDWHWLPSKGSKRVIIKFSKRIYANSNRRVKKNLKGMDLSSIGNRSPVYINQAYVNTKKCFGKNEKNSM